MKRFENAELVEVAINTTAYGPSDPTQVDSEKTLVQIDGQWGWVLESGESVGKPVSEN